jgi:hypothetical protein
MSIEEAILEKVRALPPAKNKGILACGRTAGDVG